MEKWINGQSDEAEEDKMKTAQQPIK